jgi:hypothetical protein
MGNQVSAVKELVKQLDAASPSSSTLDALTKLSQIVPYWQSTQEGRMRELHDFTSIKLLPAALSQLAYELTGVNIASREYSYISANVGVVLHVVDLLLSSKALYKQLPKQSLTCVSLALQAAIRRGDDDIALQASTTIRAIIERVGFRERKAGKEQNQVSREADAKARFVTEGGLIEVVLDSCSFLHARSNPLVADSVLRLAVSLLCSRQDTTPFAAVIALHTGLSARLPLLFEFSRHAYPRLRVAACGLLKGLFMEGTVASAAALQVSPLPPPPHQCCTVRCPCNRATLARLHCSNVVSYLTRIG